MPETGTLTVSKQSRFLLAVRAVWERSHQQYLAWPEVRRIAAQPAVDALSAWLGDCQRETELDIRYWEPGDLPGLILLQHLPPRFDIDDRLTLEEACFWRRLLELRGQANCST